MTTLQRASARPHSRAHTFERAVACTHRLARMVSLMTAKRPYAGANNRGADLGTIIGDYRSDARPVFSILPAAFLDARPPKRRGGLFAGI